MGVGQLKRSWLPGEAGAGIVVIPLSSRTIGRKAVPPYTTTAPGRGEGTAKWAVQSQWRKQRERETVFTEMTADWLAASEGPQGASVLLRGYRDLTDTDRPR